MCLRSEAELDRQECFSSLRNVNRADDELLSDGKAAELYAIGVSGSEDSQISQILFLQQRKQNLFLLPCL